MTCMLASHKSQMLCGACIDTTSSPIQERKCVRECEQLLAVMGRGVLAVVLFRCESSNHTGSHIRVTGAVLDLVDPRCLNALSSTVTIRFDRARGTPGRVTPHPILGWDCGRAGMPTARSTGTVYGTWSYSRYVSHASVWSNTHRRTASTLGRPPALGDYHSNRHQSEHHSSRRRVDEGRFRAPAHVEITSYPDTLHNGDPHFLLTKCQ